MSDMQIYEVILIAVLLFCNHKLSIYINVH